jgi:hypothetical protein
MAISHDAPIAFRLPGRFPFRALAKMARALVLCIRRPGPEALPKRTSARLSAQLRRDVGEIDHLPPTMPSFLDSGPTTYQDRLQRAWVR